MAEAIANAISFLRLAGLLMRVAICDSISSIERFPLNCESKGSDMMLLSMLLRSILRISLSFNSIDTFMSQQSSLSRP